MEIADFQLTTGERFYLVEGSMPDKSDLPWKGIPLTKERAAELDTLYQCVADHFNVGLDNHGSTVYLAILKKKESDDKRLFGFRYSYGGEMLNYGCQYGDETLLKGEGSPIFVIETKEVVKTIYTHSDGSPIPPCD